MCARTCVNGYPNVYGYTRSCAFSYFFHLAAYKCMPGWQQKKVYTRCAYVTKYVLYTHKREQKEGKKEKLLCCKGSKRERTGVSYTQLSACMRDGKSSFGVRCLDSFYSQEANVLTCSE
ncbi:hypothetical protein POVWA2_008620 [Plasmodium ovale wallikeri]|uniref:Uncharacterized protein n=1 Tax=Plasmodium ovale wallikeri TaxID=864142 RepID=A0A1A8YL44_PLAOA|nr:hypothetical protein POVWA1_008630 [Plasmodium ovale wallikeri]SBT32264.1 hypothetical protein POVWA2_008620 [Plasmodium ovale wallikeri]